MLHVPRRVSFQIVYFLRLNRNMLAMLLVYLHVYVRTAIFKLQLQEIGFRPPIQLTFIWAGHI